MSGLDSGTVSLWGIVTRVLSQSISTPMQNIKQSLAEQTAWREANAPEVCEAIRADSFRNDIELEAIAC